MTAVVATLLPLLVSRVHFWKPLLLYLEDSDSQGNRKSAKAVWVTHDRLTSAPHTDVGGALSSEMSL